MKTPIFILLLLLALSCQEEETNMGCQTGILKTDATNTRVRIRCSTEAQHLAGSNTAAGGTDLFIYYRDVKWAKCGECK